MIEVIADQCEKQLIGEATTKAAVAGHYTFRFLCLGRLSRTWMMQRTDNTQYEPKLLQK